jgi:hypothetical protein
MGSFFRMLLTRALAASKLENTGGAVVAKLPLTIRFRRILEGDSAWLTSAPGREVMSAWPDTRKFAAFCVLSLGIDPTQDMSRVGWEGAHLFAPARVSRPARKTPGVGRIGPAPTHASCFMIAPHDYVGAKGRMT